MINITNEKNELPTIRLENTLEPWLAGANLGQVGKVCVGLFFVSPGQLGQAEAGGELDVLTLRGAGRGGGRRVDNDHMEKQDLYEISLLCHIYITMLFHSFLFIN